MAALSVDSLRSELEMFANMTLRRELADLAGLIKKELREDLRMFHADGCLGQQRMSLNAQSSPPSPEIPGQVVLHPEVGLDMEAPPKVMEGSEMLQPGAPPPEIDRAQPEGGKEMGSDPMAQCSFLPGCVSMESSLGAQAGNNHIPKLNALRHGKVQNVGEPEDIFHERANVEQNWASSAAQAEVPKKRETTSTKDLLFAVSEAEMSRMQTTSSMPSNQGLAYTIVSSLWFELFINVTILLNAIFIGAVTDYLAKSMERNAGPVGTVLEVLFISIFVAEVCLKFVVHRLDLFRLTYRDGSRNRMFYWNVFDFSVIFVQLLEIILDHAAVQAELLPGVSTCRILRILRMLRIVRAIKLVGLFSDLRNIVHSVTHSLSLFLWSVMALLLVTFLWSVLFTHLVWDHRLQCLATGVLQCKGDEDLIKHFGTLDRSMLSLLMAVTGGVDWGDLYELLSYLNAPVLGNSAYLAYVLFALLALQNVITGIFFDTASRKGKDEAELIALSHARAVFADADGDNSGKITREDFERVLEHKHVESFFEALELRIEEGAALFDLLDASGDGTISSDEFFGGCLKVRGQAKALDLLVLAREVSSLCSHNFKEIKMNRAAMESNRQEIKNTKTAIEANYAVMKDLQAFLMSTEQS